MEEHLTEEQLYEKYEYLVVTTIHKKFKSPNKLAQSKGLDYDDLLQFGRMGLLKGIRTFDPNRYKMKFKNFLINNIRWSIMLGLRDQSVTHRYYKGKPATDDNIVTMISMSTNPYFKLEDDDSFYDIIAQDNIFQFGSMFPDPETTVISNYKVSKMFDKLTEKEQQIIHMRLNEDLTYQEIANRLGYTKQGIGMIFKKMHQKYRDYLHNIAEVTP
jgi:RNA polymerase sigma factor (sigma-70 family)